MSCFYGEERQLERTVFHNGDVEHFEGPKGEERRVRTVFPDSTVQHYKGSKGEERCVSRVLTNGDVEFFLTVMLCFVVVRYATRCSDN